MRITVHADDLGATENVNQNILSVWSAGALNSVSVIANGDAVEQAAAFTLQDISRPLRIMVHLNLSEGKPLADSHRVPLLVDANGRFHMGFIGLWRLWLKMNHVRRAEFLDQVEQEFTAQIARINQLFYPRKASGVDGHIHIQMLPFLFPIAARLAARSGLNEIRISQEIFHFSPTDSLRPGYPANIIKHFLLNRLAGPARQSAAQFGLVSPDSIAGVLYSGHMSRSSASAAIIATHKKHLNWLELIFHPGRAIASEMNRWPSQGSIGNFYADPYRDTERDELLLAGSSLQQ